MAKKLRETPGFLIAAPLTYRKEPVPGFIERQNDPVGLKRHCQNFSRTEDSGAGAAATNRRRDTTALKYINRILRENLACQTQGELDRICLSAAEAVTSSRFSFAGEFSGENRLDVIAVSDNGLASCQIPKRGDNWVPFPKGLVANGIYRKILSNERGFYENNCIDGSVCIRLPKGHPPLRSFLGVPLTLAGKLIGMVGVANRPGGYRDIDLKTLGKLAPALTQAMFRRRTEASLKQLNEELELRVSELAHLAEKRACRLQALAEKIIDAEESERGRIAEILHGDLQQVLASARLKLQSAIHQLPDLPELAEVEWMITQSINKSRNLSHDLSPEVLTRQGLEGPLVWLIRRMEEQLGLQVDLAVETDPQFENPSLKMFLFRAVQELLFNISKHAGVKSAKVLLTGTPDEGLILRICDRGIGFNPHCMDTKSAAKGAGLSRLKERAHAIGVHLSMKSAPGFGSSFTMTVPFDLLAGKAGAQLDPPRG